MFKTLSIEKTSYTKQIYLNNTGDNIKFAKNKQNNHHTYYIGSRKTEYGHTKRPKHVLQKIFFFKVK